MTLSQRKKLCDILIMIKIPFIRDSLPYRGKSSLFLRRLWLHMLSFTVFVDVYCGGQRSQGAKSDYIGVYLTPLVWQVIVKWISDSLSAMKNLSHFKPLCDYINTTCFLPTIDSTLLFNVNKRLQIMLHERDCMKNNLLN